MQRLNTLNKTYESGEILSSDNLNLIINYINQSINAINELMINNDVSIGHYEIRYKDSLSEPSPPSTGSSGLSDGWKRSIDSAVYNIWMTLCFVTIGNTYGTWTKAIKISAKDGSNGSFILEVYRNDSAASVDSVYIPEVIDNSYSSPAFPPIGWTTAILTKAEGEYTWCILRTISFNENNDPIYGKWSTPFKLTGDNGKDGEDGKYLEYIYKHFTSAQTWQQIDSNPANWSISDTSLDILSGQENRINPQREDYIGPSELGWTDNPQGVTDIYKYEYVCQRIYNGKSYEAFTSPVIWSKYGDRGHDGDGYEYIFKGGPTYGTHPNQINTPDPSSIGQTKNDDDFVPDGWSDDPVTLTEQLLYVWVSTRKRKGGESWGNFSDPKIWAHWADQGANGGHWEFIYINFQSTPTKPSDGTSLSNLPSGWTTIPSTPDVANGYYTWMSQCFVSGEGVYGEWTLPIRITGEDGLPGTDGDLTEFIYTRNNTGVAPSVPPSNGTYPRDWPNDGTVDHLTDGNGVTWYDNPQGVASNMMYEYVSTRSYNGTTKTWGNYSSPVIWSKWGEKGLDGDGVEYIFYANTTGSIPSGQHPDSWEANQTPGFKGPDGSLWQDDPIDLSTLGQGAKQWISKRKKTTTNGVTSWGTFSPPALWSTYAKDGVVDGYTVDLTNENMPVGTDSSGNVLNYSNVCGVLVFHNGVEENNFTISAGTITRSDNTAVGNSITATVNNTNKTITVAISNASNFSAVNAYVPVTVAITTLNGTITRNLTISLFGIATGEAGAAIDLFTSASAIRCDYERTTSTPSTLSVGVKVSSPTSGVHKYNAGSTEARNMGMTFGYFYNGDSTSEQVISSSISLSSKIGGTNITDITIVMRYNNVIVDSETIPFVSDGAPGEYYAQLLSGIIMRTKSWNSITSNEMIEDGTTASSDGVIYLDVVEYNGSYYRIKTRTLKQSGTAPPEKADGSVNEDYWYMFAPSGDAAFNALIADSAFISNLTAKEVVITENNAPVAGLTGGTAQTGDAFTRGSVRIWAGNPIVNGTTNLTNCPFYVTNTGELHANNASISGNITATGGRFTGEFRVGDATSVNDLSGGFFKILPYREVPRSNGLTTILSGAIVGCDGTGRENLIISANGGNDNGSYGFTNGSHFDEDEIMLRIDSPDGGDNGKYYIVSVKNNVYKSGDVETTYYSYYLDPNESSNNPKSHVPSIFTIGINARGKVQIKSEVNGGGHAWETDADKIYYGDVYLDGDGYLRVKTWR